MEGDGGEGERRRTRGREKGGSKKLRNRREVKKVEDEFRKV